MQVFQITRAETDGNDTFRSDDVGKWCLREPDKIMIFDTRDEAEAAISARRIHHMEG